MAQSVYFLSNIFFVFLFASINFYAQSTNPESPTPVASNELRKATQGNGREYYYSFWANPGQLNLQISISSRSSVAGAEIHFLNQDFVDISAFVLIQSADAPLKKNIEIVEKEQIIVKIKELEYGSNGSYPGNLVIKFGGSFFVPSKEDRSENKPNSSTDGSVSLENPTLIKSFKLEKKVVGDDRQRYYSFVSKPGKVTISFDLKATMDNVGTEIYFLDKQGNQLADFIQIQAINKSNERISKTISVKRLSTVILKIKEMSYGSRGSYPGILSINFTGSFVVIK